MQLVGLASVITSMFLPLMQ